MITFIAIDEDAHPPADKPWRFPGGTHTVLYAYHSGSYEGSGAALALVRRRGAGGSFTNGLSHCSCYGPWDNPKWSRLTAGGWDQEDTDRLLAEAKRLGLDVGNAEMSPECPAPPPGINSWEV